MDVDGITSAVNVIEAQTADTTVTGSAIDTTGYQGSLKVILNAGAASAGTTPTLDVKIQTSDTTTSGDFADVTDLAFDQVTDTASFQELRVPKGSIKKYIRAVCTIGGTNTPTFAFAVCFVGEKQYK